MLVTVIVIYVSKDIGSHCGMSVVVLCSLRGKKCPIEVGFGPDGYREVKSSVAS